MKLPELSRTDFGLIGYPLGHSQSKAFFAEYFATEGLDYSYDNFEMPQLSPEALYTLVLLNPCLKGFNVTAPYKEAILDYLDSRDAQAERVGAVNTVKIDRDATGRVTALRGFNTDVVGFAASVEPLLVGLPADAGALILGSGGASKAVAVALEGLGRRATIVSRTPRTGQLAYADIDAATIERNPLIVNATPLGTWPDTAVCPPFPYHLLNDSCRCHDLVYNPSTTEFMRRAEAQGATVKNGLEMLHRQALASFEIWTSTD